jgi:uncharacterized protein (TIGR03437 family)
MVAGVHNAEVTIRSGQNVLRIPVTLTITAAPAIISVSPSPLPQGNADVPVTISGGGFTPDSYVEVNGTRVTSTFVDDRTLRATVPSVLVLQQGVVRLTVSTREAQSDPFELQVVSETPALSAGGLLNAASRASGPIAAGEIVIVPGAGFGGLELLQAPLENGRLPTAFSNTRVLFDGIPAPILWARSGEVAVVVPYSVANRTSSEVIVEYGNLRSTPIVVPVEPAAPGLFTASGAGNGQAAAYNQDGTLNDAAAPAARGAIVTLYATGEGLTSPVVEAGTLAPEQNTPAPVLGVTVQIGGVSAEVFYAGASPGQITGLLQLNVRIPEGAPAGDAVPVTLSVGSTSSAVGPTLAIR